MALMLGSFDFLPVSASDQLQIRDALAGKDPDSAFPKDAAAWVAKLNGSRSLSPADRIELVSQASFAATALRSAAAPQIQAATSDSSLAAGARAAAVRGALGASSVEHAIRGAVRALEQDADAFVRANFASHPSDHPKRPDLAR